MPETNTSAPACPECVNGKCSNCTTDVLDTDDQWVLCACPTCGGGLVGFRLGQESPQ